MTMEQSVPKRRHIKFRRRGNYPEESIQTTWNVVYVLYMNNYDMYSKLQKFQLCVCETI